MKIKYIFIAVLFLGCFACSSADISIVHLNDQRINVGHTLVFDVCVTDAGGETVTITFEVPSLPSSGAALDQDRAECGTFRWTPTSDHIGIHQFTFRASAGDSSDTTTIDIEVIATSSAPIFLQPGAGGTYDLSRDPCVKVHIEVKDDDSNPSSISIYEKEPKIEGASLAQSGKTADWNWCPGTQQIEANDRYTLMLQAQDEVHDPVQHDFVIVLRGVSKDDCPGEAPQIVSSAPPPPDTVASNQDYQVAATITDDLGIKEMPILYYSFDPPDNPEKPDVTAMSQVMFEGAGGSNFVAYIPNPGLDEITVMTVYYVISVTDNDDEEGVLCDHRVDGPLTQFNITGGSGDLAGYCERCSSNSQCASGGCVEAAAPFCAAPCDDACAGLGGVCQDVLTVGGSMVNLCVPPGLDCSGTGECTDDTYEDNDTRAWASSITAGTFPGLMICPDDEDFYSINVSSASDVDVLIYGWDAGTIDIDLQLLKPDGGILKTSASLDAEENVHACVADIGLYTIRVYGILDDSGPYDMIVEVLPGSCCVNDGSETNDDYAAATYVSGPSTVDGVICPSDNDWFRIHADAGQKLNADLLIDGGDLDLKLYDTDGMSVLDTSAGMGELEHVEQDITVSGDYYLRVYGYGDATGDYSLEFSFTASSTCASTSECDPGNVCNGASCIDDSCYPPGSCPAGHFCPAPGGSASESDCVDNCTDSSTCREGYSCKVFEDGQGCAQSGSGYTGDNCDSFRDCRQEMTCLPSSPWTGGYCARIECVENADCPFDSFCIEVTTHVLGVCVLDCDYFSDYCRLSDGYTCSCQEDAEGENQDVCLPPGVDGPGCWV